VRYGRNSIGCNRIIFPVFDSLNNVKTFTSRLIKDSLASAIPVHKHLPKHHTSIYDPTSCKSEEVLFWVEGPFDRLTLEQAELNAVCFFGTNGFRSQYANLLNKAKTIYCIPDSEDNPIPRKANFRSYITFHNEIGGVRKIYIISLPRSGPKKVDPNSYFRNMKDIDIRNSLMEFAQDSVLLVETEEFEEYLRAKSNSISRATIDKEKRDRLKRILSVPIHDVFTEILGVELEKFSGIFACRCIHPEHNDDTPSMRIYPKTGTFYCFGCGETGDVIGAVSIVTGLGFKESCKMIEKEFGL
jgi:hypothetical protein